jgi:hypothetical protein
MTAAAVLFRFYVESLHAIVTVPAEVTLVQHFLLDLKTRSILGKSREVACRAFDPPDVQMVIMAEMYRIHVRGPEGNVSAAGCENGDADSHDEDKKIYVFTHCRLPMAARTILLVTHIKRPLAIMTLAAEITLGQFFHVHLVRSLRHLKELIVTIAAAKSFFIYVFFVTEENGPRVLGRERYITTPDLLCKGTHRGQKACGDYSKENQSFHVHHPHSRN